MEEKSDKNVQSAPVTQENKGILINGIHYSYSITKSENEEESLIIKLYEPEQKSNLYFTYEASTEKISKDIKFLSICEDREEMIASLNEAFSQGNVQVEEKDEVYNMEFKVSGFGIKKKCIIQLTKHEIEQPKEQIKELEGGMIEQFQNKLNDLYNKFEQLKTEKENVLKEDNITKIIKKLIFDEDIKMKFFEEMEKLFLSKYNLNNNQKNKENSVENEMINKTEDSINIKEEKINTEIINIQKQIKEGIEYLKTIKSTNYITLQVKIDKNNLNKDVRLFNQVTTYKYFCNFERDDIEVIINDKIVPIKYKKNNYFEYNKESKNCEQSQYTEYNLNINYYYYWNFSKTGIYDIKIIFKKKLLKCKKLFADTDCIYKIDCSNFDCSQVNDCSSMFYKCYSLVEINLGKLDFSLSNDFSSMFYKCKILRNLDVSNFNTENSISFGHMFEECYNLKEINVSKFKTTACENIVNMFSYCKALKEIDMLNWNFENLHFIRQLFFGCSNLKHIKMNFNDKISLRTNGWISSNYPYKEDNSLKEVFKGLPEGGSFVWKKGINCNRILKHLPVSWNRTQE